MHDERIHDLPTIAGIGYRATRATSLARAITELLHATAARGVPVVYPVAGDPVEPAVVAEVAPWVPRPSLQLARWIGFCNLEYGALTCRGAMVLQLDDPRFYCTSCYNEAVGHRWRQVSFPAEREAGEAVLMARAPTDRAWEPGETVDDLVAQNLAAGDPVPADLEQMRNAEGSR